MVTHEEAKRGLLVVVGVAPATAPGLLAGRRRGAVRDLRAHRAGARPVPGHRRRERAVLHRRAGRRAARRCCARRAFGGAVRACCSTTSWSRPGTRFTIAEPDSADHHRGAAGGGGRGRGAGRRRGQPRPGGPARVAGGRTARAVRRIGAARRRPEHAAGAGPGDLLPARRSACCANDSTATGGYRRLRRHRTPAPTSIPPTPRSRSATTSSGCCWPGKKLPARDRRVLGAVAKQAAGLVKQRELTEEAGKAEAIAQADELRRSLLSAVSHDLRTPLAAAKAAVSSLRSRRRRLLPRGHRRTAGHRRGVDRPAHRAGRQPARLVAAGRRGGPARAAPGVPGGDGAARAARNRQRPQRVSAGQRTSTG